MTHCCDCPYHKDCPYKVTMQITYVEDCKHYNFRQKLKSITIKPQGVKKY